MKQKKFNKDSKNQAVVSVYELDSKIWNHSLFKIKRFDGPTAEWLSFILSCRKEIDHNFEVVFGAVANDKIYVTIALFESGVLSVEETIARLKVDDYFDQISFHTNSALAKLTFLTSILAVTTHNLFN